MTTLNLHRLRELLQADQTAAGLLEVYDSLPALLAIAEAAEAVCMYELHRVEIIRHELRGPAEALRQLRAAIDAARKAP